MLLAKHPSKCRHGKGMDEISQFLEELGNSDDEKKFLEEGLKHFPSFFKLWKKNSHIPELWLAAVQAELRRGNKKEAETLMAKALQECPNSGIFRAASIEMVPRPQRKTKCRDARKNCGDKEPR
ncbi:hypothetical protein M0R45_026770 [Rubus argutus]|uniref:Uncharacterized protein n=1 Tax=Rubus argutus TaxID=59490 RepID=A0AAW1WZ42_RUBAR